MTSTRDRIKVVTRIRPKNQIEIQGNYRDCVEYDDTQIKVTCEPESKVSDMAGTHKFSFDRIFGPDSRQVDVFDEVAAPVVEGVLNGYNGTIFAYGQTGSGKSFTMEGVKDDVNLRGLIPRMFYYLFDCINKADEAIEFSIKCSYLEIYMEKIQDLLDIKKNNLQVKESKQKGIYIDDATEVHVSSPDEMFKVMQAGSANRSVAATRMNAVSSRSHSVFLVQVAQKNTKTDASKVGKLYCCDLAGSEKIGKTLAQGQTLEEAKMINKSLSALGNVINALTEGKNGGFIPYRDSKLTRILQESLGGNSSTVLVITCSLSQYNDRETLSTMRFGNRAKNIKNKVKQNAERSAKELMILLDAAEKKIAKTTQIVTLIQTKLKELIKESQGNDDVQAAYEKLKVELQSISNAQDLDLLLATLKGDLSDTLLQATMAETQESQSEQNVQPQQQQLSKPETTSSLSQDLTPINNSEVLIQQPVTPRVTQQETQQEEIKVDSSKPKSAEDKAKEKQANKEKAAKIYKQHMEIQKLKNELQSYIADKEELETEIKNRNQELYQLNEKLILLELNQTMSLQTVGKDQKTIEDMQTKIERFTDNNVRKQADLQKLRQILDRLKCDLHVFMLGRKLNNQNAQSSKDNSADQIINVSHESEGQISEQIQTTIDLVTKLEAAFLLDSQVDSEYEKDLKLRKRRRSAGNLSMSMIMNSQGQQSNGKQQDVNGSKRSLLMQNANDTTMMTEQEYLNYLPENSQLVDISDSSFLKAINPIETATKPQDPSQDLEKIKDLESLVAQQKEQLQALQDSYDSLQKSQITDPNQSPTKLNSSNQENKESNFQLEESKSEKTEPTEIQDNKDNNELPSDQEILIQELKDQLEKEKSQRLRDKHNMEAQYALREKQMKGLIGENVDKKQMFQLKTSCDILTEKNKLLFTEVVQLRKQYDRKEKEWEGAAEKISSLEKQLVIAKRESQQAKILNKIPGQATQANPLASFMQPFQSSHGQMHLGSYYDQVNAQTLNQPFGNNMNQQNQGVIFNRKVIKTVKGGGQGNKQDQLQKDSLTRQMTMNQTNQMDFNDFMNNQTFQKQKTAVSSKQLSMSAQKQNTNNKRNSILASGGAIPFSNQSVPIIKPENKKEFEKQMQGYSSQQQITQHQKQQQQQLAQAKKMIQQQKIEDAKRISQQQIMEESVDYDLDEDSEDEDSDGNDTSQPGNDEIDPYALEQQIKSAMSQYNSASKKKQSQQKSITGKLMGGMGIKKFW